MRSFLPNPSIHDSHLFLVSVGRFKSEAIQSIYVQTSDFTRVFIFERYPVDDRQFSHQWICLDAHLQKLVYHNWYEATILLEQLNG